MRDKVARGEIDALRVRVETLSQALASALHGLSRVQSLGAELSTEFVKAAAIMSNFAAHNGAMLEVQGRGLRGTAALKVFNTAREAHKSAWPSLHDAAHWVVPDWMLMPAVPVGRPPVGAVDDGGTVSH